MASLYLPAAHAVHSLAPVPVRQLAHHPRDAETAAAQRVREAALLAGELPHDQAVVALQPVELELGRGPLADLRAQQHA